MAPSLCGRWCQWLIGMACNLQCWREEAPWLSEIINYQIGTPDQVQMFTWWKTFQLNICKPRALKLYFIYYIILYFLCLSIFSNFLWYEVLNFHRLWKWFSYGVWNKILKWMHMGLYQGCSASLHTVEYFHMASRATFRLSENFQAS